MMGVLSAILVTGIRHSASADIIHFTLEGRAGSGILAANQNPSMAGGTGGIVAGGIFFDTNTNQLTMNIGWGSGQGFTDLTSPVSLLNLHGPTADAAPISYNQNAGGLISLAGVNTSPTNGGYSGTVTIATDNVDDLLTGRLYVHIHTRQNSGGEARGYLIAVPEPGSLPVLIASVAAVLTRRNRPTPRSQTDP